MQLSEARGKLLAIGGSEDKENDCEILKEFIRLSKGPKARIVVMTVATDKVRELSREYKDVFNRLGVDDVEVVDVSNREDAQSEEAINKIDAASGVFFTGGDQLHITALLGGSKVHNLLYKKFKQGTLVAGTSAGASMMGNSMIIKGGSDETPRLGSVGMAAGMDFVLGAVIDVHFSQRGRLGRLLAAIAHHPQDLGIGVDENTAILFRNNHFEVIGEGAVYVVDAGNITYTNITDIEEKEGLSLYDVRVHVLTRGHGFDLSTRRPMIDGKPVKDEAPPGASTEAAGSKLNHKKKAAKR